MNWKEFWAQVRQIWEDSSGYLSSKRIFGSIGFICAIIMAFNKVPVDVIIENGGRYLINDVHLRKMRLSPLLPDHLAHGQHHCIHIGTVPPVSVCYIKIFVTVIVKVTEKGRPAPVCCKNSGILSYFGKIITQCSI